MDAFVWLGLLAVFLLVEAVTVGLTTIWFAGGALLALLLSFLEISVWLQVAVFLGTSLALLIFTRPAAVRLLNKKTEATNVDALVGKKAVVTERIDNLRDQGTVRINGLEWMARSSKDDRILEKDAVVAVLQVTGVKLIVEEWREDVV